MALVRRCKRPSGMPAPPSRKDQCGAEELRVERTRSAIQAWISCSSHPTDLALIRMRLGNRFSDSS